MKVKVVIATILNAKEVIGVVHAGAFNNRTCDTIADLLLKARAINIEEHNGVEVTQGETIADTTFFTAELSDGVQFIVKVVDSEIL